MPTTQPRLVTAPVFVLRPGDPLGQHDNVYIDSTSLWNAASLVPGSKRIEIDGSLAPVNWLADGVQDMSGVEFFSSQEAIQGYTLNLNDGVQWTFTSLYVNGVFIESNSIVLPVFTLNNPGGFAFLFIYLEGSVWSNTAVATFLVQAGELSAEVSDLGNIGDGTHPTIKTVAPGSFAGIFVDGSELEVGALDPTSTGTSSISYDAGSPPGSQAPLTPTLTLLDTAPNVAYTPAVAGDWAPVPTAVAPALDQLAARRGSDIIWQPGGVASGNTVTTWAAVQAAVDAVKGAIRVYIDTSIAAAVIPAGTWNGYGAAEIKPWGESFLVTIADGGTLEDWARCDGMVIACTCTTTAALSFPNPGSSSFILDNLGTITLLAGAAVPAIQLAVPGFSFALISRTGSLDNSQAPTVPVIGVAAGTTATLYMQCAAPNFPALMTGNEIGGPVGATVFWENDATVPALASTLFLGTINQEPTSSSTNTTYTPAVLANWSGVAPTSTANALDRIAAKIGPIP